MDWSLAIVIWIICGIASFAIAQAKGATNAGTYFVLGVLLGPLGILAAAIGAKPPAGQPPVGQATPASATPQPTWPSSSTPPAARPVSVADELEKLIRLREAGELSAAEFARARVNLMSGNAPAPASTWSPVPAATATPSPAQPGPTWTEGSPQTSRSNVIVVLVIAVIALGAVALLMLQGQGGGGGPASVSDADLPPAGIVWFGDSFDADTFEIRGRSGTFGATTPFSAVIHLKRATDGSSMSVRTYWDNQLVATTPLSWQGTSEIWGTSLGPVFEPGIWRYEWIDVGGNILASGAITAE